MVVSEQAANSHGSADWTNFQKSQDITCKVIQQLDEKADFLCKMVHFELYDPEKLT